LSEGGELSRLEQAHSTVQDFRATVGRPGE